MELGKPCKGRKEVREGIINLESKRIRLAEMVMNPSDELQPTWLKTILFQMLDKETKLHVGEEIGKDGVTFEQAKARVTDFITLNEDQGKASLDSAKATGPKPDWTLPYDQWDNSMLKQSLDALKGGGKKGGGKGGECWTCGKPGHQSRDCWHNPKGGKGFEKG